MKTNIKIKTKFAREGLLRHKPQHERLWDRSWGVLGCVWRSGGTVEALLGVLGAL